MATQPKPAPGDLKAAPAPAGAKPEREPLLVDLGFQAREMLPLLVFAGLYALLLYTALFLPLNRSIAREPDLGIRVILQAQLGEIHLRLWPLLVVAGLLAAYLRIYRTLGVLRPVYRLHYALHGVAAGESPTLRVKKGEEFRFLEEDIAQLNQKMKLIATRNRDILLNVNAHMKTLADRLAADEIIARADLDPRHLDDGVLRLVDSAPQLVPLGCRRRSDRGQRREPFRLYPGHFSLHRSRAQVP